MCNDYFSVGILIVFIATLFCLALFSKQINRNAYKRISERWKKEEEEEQETIQERKKIYCPNLKCNCLADKCNYFVKYLYDRDNKVPFFGCKKNIIITHNLGFLKVLY